MKLNLLVYLTKTWLAKELGPSERASQYWRESRTVVLKRGPPLGYGLININYHTRVHMLNQNNSLNWQM